FEARTGCSKFIPISRINIVLAHRVDEDGSARGTRRPDGDRLNRNQRRAMEARNRSERASHSASPDLTAAVAMLFDEARRAQHHGRNDDAAKLYRRLLALKPDHAEASNNLACIFLAQRKLRDASAQFAHTLAMRPQLLDDFSDICRTLVA